MPGLGGFDVIEAVGPESMPLVVFVTAHDEHAIRAFEVQALDHLLKPVDEQRLLLVLDRVRNRRAGHDDGSLARRLAALLASAAAQRVAVRDRGRILLLRAGEIECVQAEGDYAWLQVGEKTYLVRETMAALEERLGPAFLRIHRSAVVNTAFIREVRPQPNGEALIVLHGGLEFRASRGYADRLRGATGNPL